MSTLFFKSPNTASDSYYRGRGRALGERKETLFRNAWGYLQRLFSRRDIDFLSAKEALVQAARDGAVHEETIVPQHLSHHHWEEHVMGERLTERKIQEHIKHGVNATKHTEVLLAEQRLAELAARTPRVDI